MTKEEKLYYANIGLAGLFVMVACACGFHAWKEKQYADFDQLPNLLFAFGALMAFLFPSEMSDFDSYQGWNSRDWRHTPSWWIKFCGFLAFPYFAYQILTT